MKQLYTVLPILFLSIFLQGQGVFESYDHNILRNRPAHAYEYKDGIVTVNYIGEQIDFGTAITYFGVYFNFINSDGNIQFIGITKQIFSSDLMNNIKFHTNPDSSLTIISSNMICSDIPCRGFDVFNFDGEIVEEINYEDFSLQYEAKVSKWGNNSYIFSMYDSLALHDINLNHLKTLDYSDKRFEICESEFSTLLYHESDIYTINTTDTTLNQILEVDSMLLCTYQDSLHVLVFSDRVEIYDFHLTNLNQSIDLPADQFFNGRLYLKNEDLFVHLKRENEGSIWVSRSGSSFERFDLALEDDNNFKFIFPTDNYDYYLSSWSSNRHEHGLVNKVLKNNYDANYDMIEPLEITAGEIILDSIKYGGFHLLGDTVSYYNHYYNGYVTINNTSNDTIDNTNLHYSHHHAFGYSHNINLPIYNILPNETIDIPIHFVSRDEQNLDSISFRLYGANDRRFVEEVEYNIPITASISNLELTEVSVCPNPTSQMLVVTTEHPIQSLQVFDQMGKLVLTISKNIVDVSHLSEGAYLLYIVDDQGSTGAKQFVVEK